MHPACLRRYYASDAELHRLFKSVNGIVFPGGLTNLWTDSPYVLAARKLWNWAKEANDNGTQPQRNPASDTSHAWPM